MSKWKNIGISILVVVIALFVGAISSTNSGLVYEELVLPPLSPPAYLFGIVWPILYGLMGVSLYLVLQSVSGNQKKALIWFGVQLLLNLIWPFVFFGMGNYAEALGILLLLWVALVMMMEEFYEVNPLAMYLQIPYLIWITFATYLNFAIMYLN